VFNATDYKKVLWMDGDTLVLKNIDHLFRRPMLTGAFTVSGRGGRQPPG
jgi:alpha-N-acetylglucosamine transferase